jgi:hypothetical protein
MVSYQIKMKEGQSIKPPLFHQEINGAIPGTAVAEVYTEMKLPHFACWCNWCILLVGVQIHL